MSAQWLRDNFMFGVNLTNDKNEPFPESMYELAIDSAIELVEAETGIVIGEAEETERYDLTAGDWFRNYEIQTDRVPLSAIASWKLQQGDFPPITMPANWIYIRDKKLGIVEIILGTGTPTFAYNGQFLYGGHVFDTRKAAAAVITYTAGFHPTTTIPASVRMLVGWLGAMLPLDTAGDLIAGAGIASYSKSMDGISESVSTTSSATNAGYGARIISYQKQIKDAMRQVKARYRGLPMHAS